MFHYSLISVLLIAQGGKIASNGPDLRCGANCLYIALKALELTTENFSALEDRLGQPRFQGYTLAQLHEAASDFGAHSYPVLTSPERLRQRRSLGESFACIAHLKRDHFVLVTDMNDQTIHIVDPPIVYDVPLGTFHSMFSGHALLIGREALRSEDAIAATVGGSDWIWVCLGVIAASSAAVLIVWGLPKARIGRSALVIVLAVAAAGCGGEAKNRSELGRPRVVVENEHIDLGELDLRGSTPGVANFILRNEGSAPLQLRNVSSSCGCAVASIETPLINQGAESKLVVSVPPKGNPVKGEVLILSFSQMIPIDHVSISECHGSART